MSRFCRTSSRIFCPIIFGCLVAAIAIYGLSYWQARQIIQRIVGGWILDLAQSDINNVAKKIESKLLRIELNTLLLFPSIQDFNFERENIPLLNNFVKEQSEVKAIAVLEITDREIITTKERLIEIVNSPSLVNPARVIRTIQHFCQQFVGNAAQSDDITLLAVQYLPLSPFFQMANIMEWNLSINSELTELAEVKQHLSKILQAANLTVELIEDVQLIVEEVLVNIIQYGYKNCTQGNIDLAIEMNLEQLILTFKDNAKPFNPLTEISSPDLTMNDEQRSLGGLGFFLVQELAEQVNYFYQNAQNILTVTLAIAKTV